MGFITNCHACGGKVRFDVKPPGFGEKAVYCEEHQYLAEEPKPERETVKRGK